ncbi:MAG: class II fructose-bisphosphate aldolase, partial [Parcubacteria group bacterium]|nr:class II fructose-bisphosphate aldolase [Parcubacteria group bacterium]
QTNTGAFIIELAQSEMGYTDQTPQEYAENIKKAAEAEQFQGPIFLQGDHFKLKENTPENIKELEELITQAIQAGFYNIDIDCSALSLEENIKQTIYLIDFIRKIQPKDINVSVGGEVGQIGSENTSPVDLKEFLTKVKGISKIAVQTGTAHGRGGEVDFDLVEELGKIAKKHNLAGVVQHGASTLPDDIFARFPKLDVCEIHLSTGVNQIVIDNLPEELKVKIKSKKDLGPLKKEILSIDQNHIDDIVKKLEKEFSFFFEKLKVADTAELISGIYK